jgi:hypothetical protein
MSSAPLGSATHPTNLVDLVRSASAQETKRPRPSGFSLTRAGVIELAVAPILGLYLGYAVARLPEVFDAFDIPNLPMFAMLAFVAVLALAVPSEAWKLIWGKSRPLRLVSIILGLAVATFPIGIWPSGSLYYLRTRFIISLVVFLLCLVLLRDRRTLRWAVMIFVLCVTAVGVHYIDKYDPNAVRYDRNGNPIESTVERSRPNVGKSLDPNDFGAILAAAFPLALWLSVGNLRRRILWGGCALVMVAAVVPTASRGSMLAFGAAATVLIGMGARGWRRILTFVMVAGGAAVFVLMASGAQMGRFTDFGADDYNLTSHSGRWYFWKQGIVWTIKRPWGYGLDNFPTYMDIINGDGRAAHSTWVQYGMELGVAGLATFVTLCFFLGRSLVAHRRRAISLEPFYPEARREEWLASHMLAMLAAILVADTFLSNAYGTLLYMALGLMGAVLLGSPLPEAAPAEPAQPAAAPRVRGRRVAPQWTRQA